MAIFQVIIFLFFFQGSAGQLTSQDSLAYYITTSNHFLKTDQTILARELLDSIQMNYYLDADSIEKAKFLNNYGLLLHKEGSYTLAIEKYMESIRFLGDDKIEEAIRIKNIGISYRKMGKYSTALMYLNKAHLVFTEVFLDNQIVSTANSLGLIYQDMGDFSLSLKHFDLVNSIWSKTNPEKLHILYNNMGNAWFSLANMDSARTYYQRSIQVSLRYGQEVASTYNNLAEVFVEAGQLDSAAIYFQLSLSLKKISGNSSGIAYTYNMLGNLAMIQDDLLKSERYLDSARVLETEVGSLSIKMKNLELHRKLFQKQGKYKQVLLVDQQHDRLKDSIFNQEKVKTLELRAAYDLEQKDKEKKLAEQAAALARTNEQIEKQRANTTLIVLSVVILFLMVAAVLLLVLLRQRKKLRLLNVQLDAQNENIAVLNRQNLHFTKNSLTELGATIRLQASQMGSAEMRQMLAEGSSRMETVNLLYKRLFFMNEKEAQVLSSQVFLEEIVEGTLEAMLPLEHDVKVDCQIEAFELTKEQGLSLGLLVNEVLVNACKYAFNKGQGNLFVKASCNEGWVSLHLEDSGPGISATLPPNDESFGFRLIQSMAEDLGAELERKSTSSGVSYYFSFPLTADHRP